jgi:MoxR-like ATPase
MYQSLGEALMFLSDRVQALVHGEDGNGIQYNLSGCCIDLTVPNDWRDNGIVRKDVCRYKAIGNRSDITVAAYDASDRLLPGIAASSSDLYLSLPTLMILICNYIRDDPSFADMFMSFSKRISKEGFVRLHDMFMRSHDATNVFLTYKDVNKQIMGKMVPMVSEGRLVTSSSVIDDDDSDSEDARTSFDDGSFPSEYMELVPSLGDELSLPGNLIGVCDALVTGDVRSVLLHGPAGTGKTISCKLMCQRIGIPLMDTVNCTDNLDEFILGKYIPEDGGIVFRESFVTKAIRYGGAVVFEEINFARPQYLAFLNSLLDDNGMVRLDNGEVVRRHENFRFFATMNLGYYGTRELNQALYNRFNVIVDVPDLSDSMIYDMLSKRVPECIPNIQRIVAIYRKIRNKIQSEELDAVISPRNLENWARMAKYEGYIRAYEKTIVPIARSDKVFENALRGIIQMYRWDRNT